MADGRQMVGFPTHEQACKWSERFAGQKLDRILYVIGFSDGQFIRELLKQFDETAMVVIYEPYDENFLYVSGRYDVSDILQDKRVTLYCGTERFTEILNDISYNVTYERIDRIQLVLIPGYEECNEILVKIREAVEYRVRHVSIEKKTNYVLAQASRTNLMRNMPAVMKERSLYQLADRLSQCELGGIPAIIIAAGPSLDRNIREIQRAQGHAFIIAVDTALKAVLRAGISPDIIVCIDPQKESVLFEHEGIGAVPAIFGMDIPDSVTGRHTAPMFFTGTGQKDIMSSFCQRYGKESYPQLATGGSVANTAFSAALLMGFRTVILVGQDLAYTDGRGHTGAAYDNEEKNTKDAANVTHSCEVMGIYGVPVKTDRTMNVYREWFEQQIVVNPEVKVIDATEGGALIKGSEVMTLRDAIDRECAKNFDAAGIINSIPPLFSEDEQEEIRQKLLSIDESLDELKKELADGINAYRVLALAVKQNNQGLIAKSLEALKAVNDIDNTNPLMSIVHMYCIREEYEAKDALKADDGSSVDAAVDNGVRLLEAYITGADAMKQDTWQLKDRL